MHLKKEAFNFSFALLQILSILKNTKHPSQWTPSTNTIELYQDSFAITFL